MLTHSSLLQSLDGAMVVRLSGRAQRCNCQLAAACRPRGRRKSRAGVSERSCAACVRGVAVRLVPAVCVGVRTGGGGSCAGSAVFSGRAAIARTCGASPSGTRMSDVACGSEHQSAYNAWVVPALRVSISIAAPAGVCCSSHSLGVCAIAGLSNSAHAAKERRWIGRTGTSSGATPNRPKASRTRAHVRTRTLSHCRLCSQYDTAPHGPRQAASWRQRACGPHSHVAPAPRHAP